MENGKRLDLIDRNDYFKRLRIVRMSSKLLDRNGVLNLAEIALEEAPTVDAVPVVHGRWIEKEEKIWNLEKPIVTGWECSKCGEMYGHYTYNYCPNCGAKMDGDGNG